MEKNYHLILSQSDMDVLATIFDIVFKTKGLEAANPSAPISLLLKKIQETVFEVPNNIKKEEQTNAYD
jgi:hypothetical protein